MKKVTRSPAIEWQVVNSGSHRFSEGPSGTSGTLPYDLKKAFLPRSLDLMLSVKYRR